MLERAPTLFVVDDDASVRNAMQRLLRSRGYRVETFADAAAYVARPPFEGLGCLILDLRMPGMSGIELQAELKRLNHALPIVFLTGHGDLPSGVEAMKRGAVDFLQKPVDEEALVRAVELALDQRRTALAGRAAKVSARALLETLTPRELEVVRCVLSGARNKQIADYLGIAEKTVKLHRARAMHKLAAGSAAELGRLCAELGVTPQSC
jgi:FixJ family two-component response regulator